MTTIYKILAEVKFYHEYYLTGSDGNSIFSLPLISDRSQFLQDFYLRGQKGIHSDLVFTFPSGNLDKDHRLKLVPTYSGFKIAIEVSKQIIGGQVGFAPIIDLPTGSLITILATGSDNRLRSYTNNRWEGLVNASWFFTNDNAGLNFPFLSQQIDNENTSYTYEQGELAVVSGSVKSFYWDSANQPQWKSESGMNYSSEKDRVLLPLDFIYQCNPSDNLNQVSFTLRDSTNQVVFQQTKTSGGDPFDKITLSVPPTVVAFPDVLDLSKAWFQLTVSGNGGYSRTYQVVFQNLPEYNDLFGLITFNPIAGNSTFSLIDNSGLLITRYNMNGTVAVSHPVFEIWLKSKSLFWNYINDEGGVLKNLYPTLIQPSINGLQTLLPHPQTILPQPVGTQRLPNPAKESMVKIQGSQKIQDVLVPFSDQFPKGP